MGNNVFRPFFTPAHFESVDMRTYWRRKFFEDADRAQSGLNLSRDRTDTLRLTSRNLDALHEKFVADERRHTADRNATIDRINVLRRSDRTTYNPDLDRHIEHLKKTLYRQDVARVVAQRQAREVRLAQSRLKITIRTGWSDPKWSETSWSKY
jgi:hypothetical protein